MSLPEFYKKLSVIMTRVREKDQYDEVESELRREYEGALQRQNPEEAVAVLHQLKVLFHTQDKLKDEEWCVVQSEKLWNHPWSVLSTAMFYRWSAKDFEKAAAKAQEAIQRGKAEGDTTTVYMALSIYGQALIELDRMSEVEAVLAEIYEMVSLRRKLVPGDEMCLLDLAHQRGMTSPYIGQILTIVGPYFREPAFQERGNQLAEKLGLPQLIFLRRA